MSTQKRIASAVLRVAGVALAASVLSATVFGAARPATVLRSEVPVVHRLDVALVVAPRVVSTWHRALAVSPDDAAPASTVAPALAAAFVVASLAAMPLPVWRTRYVRKVSRTRGQPSIA